MMIKKRSTVPNSKQKIPPDQGPVVHMTSEEQQELRKRLFSSPTRPLVIGKSTVSTPPTVLKRTVVEPILTEESNCESRIEIDQIESNGMETHNKQWDIALVQSTKVAERTLQRVMRSYQKRSAIMGGPNKRSISGIPYIFNTMTKNPYTTQIPSSPSPYHVHKEQNNPSSSSSLQKPPSRPISSTTKGISPLKNRIVEKSTVTTTVSDKVLLGKSNGIGTLEDDNISEISSIQSFGAVTKVSTTTIPVVEPIRIPPVQLTKILQQETTVKSTEQEITMNDMNGKNFAVVENTMVLPDQQISHKIVQLHEEDSDLAIPDDIEDGEPVVATVLEVEKEEEEITSTSAADLENHAADIKPTSYSSISSSSSTSSSSKSSHSNEKEIEDPSEPLPDTKRTTMTENGDADEEDDASIEIDNRFISKLNNKYVH